MSGDLKKFIYASLFYLGLAAIFGMLNGVTDIGYSVFFAHTHFNMLGFMAMLIFGIGYFILPRFNGVDLKYPSWVKIHLYLGNLSLIGMVIFRILEVETGEEIYKHIFIFMASLQILTLLMFVVNIWSTLNQSKTEDQPSAPPQAPAEKPEKKAFVVNHESKVGDLIDASPAVKDILVSAGLRMLGQPGHVDKVRRAGITLGMAASNHGIDIDSLITQIEQELNGKNNAPETTPTTQSGDTLTIDSNTLIGKIIETYPATNAVFEKYFGGACFDCPGQAYESVELACRMHGVDQDIFIQELISVTRD